MSGMDWEAVKLVGIAVSLVSGALTVGEKLFKWGKSTYQYIKKSKKLVALREGRAEFSTVRYLIGPVGTREQVIEQLSKTVPRRIPFCVLVGLIWAGGLL